jgi:chromosome segregation ATPase
MFQNTNKKYPSLEQVNSNGVLKVEVVNQPTPIDYTTLLTSIDDKLDDLALIKQELIDANGTLTSIEGDTSAIETNTDNILIQVTATNTKLDSIQTELESQTVLLGDLKTELIAANDSLDNIETDTAAIKASLMNIEADIATIKADIATIKVDVAAIKSSVAAIEADTEEIKVAVQSINTKLDTVNSNLDSIETKLDTIHSDLTTINSTLQDEFDETQVALGNLQTAVEAVQTSFQPVDCDDVAVGSPVDVNRSVVLNKVLVEVCNADANNQQILDKLDDVITAINDTSSAEQVLLDAIDTKLEDLSLIKAELVTANATLTAIEGDTTAISTNTADILTQVTTSNTKLEDIKTKLDSQITLLGDLKSELIDANTSLDTANTTLSTISGDVALIKADIADIKVDIAAIKTSVQAIEADTEEIKVAVQSIDTKLTAVNASLDSIETKLDTINTTLQTEFDQTQAKLDEVVAAVEFAQDTFQTEDCDGNPIGAEQNVIKVVQLAKQTAAICNTAEISDPIVAAIEAQSASAATGKKQDFISWAAVANDTMTIPANKFTTVAMLAAKGEFKIENSTNNFSGDVTVSSGTVSNFIEISEDGTGTTTGATSVAQGFDTRANSADMDLANNSFLITCIRATGILQVEVYK